MCSTHRSPSTPRNVRLNTVEPTRMNITMTVSFERDVHRLLEQLQRLSRRCRIASTSAPAAPIAPPSVGVARPIRMVPSTMKISTSDGTIDTMQRTNSTPTLAVADLLGQRRHLLRPDDASTMKIHEAEQPDQNEARDERAGVHVADRLAHGIGQHDQHQRRRNDLRDGAGRRDDAGGDTCGS